MNIKWKRFDEPVFEKTVYAVWCSREELYTWLKKKFDFDLEMSEFSDGVSINLPDNLGSVIWLSDKKDFYLLLHETVHIVRFSLEDRMMITDLAVDDETFAYYQAYWFKVLWRWFNKLKG